MRLGYRFGSAVTAGDRLNRIPLTLAPIVRRDNTCDHVSASRSMVSDKVPSPWALPRPHEVAEVISEGMELKADGVRGKRAA